MSEWMAEFWYKVFEAWALDGGLEPVVMEWLREQIVLNGVCDFFNCWM